MNRGLLIGGGVVLLLLISCIGSCISFQNNAVRLESAVKGQWKDNKNTYDAFWKKVTEAAQIPDKYKEDFKELLVADTQGRYGKDGTNPMMLWMQERQLSLDPKLYERLMTIVESGRDEFKRSQQALIDKQRVYENHLGEFPGSFWAGFTGFPKAVQGDLAPPSDVDGDGLYTVLDYKAVTSKKTEAAFATGEDEALQVFGPKS